MANEVTPATLLLRRDTVTELQQAESKSMKMAERDEFAAAWRGLQKHKNAWCDQYAGIGWHRFRNCAGGRSHNRKPAHDRFGIDHPVALKA